MDINNFPSKTELNPKACTWKCIKNRYPEFYEYLNNNYPNDLSMGEKLWWYYNDVKDYPVCSICGNKVTFINITKGYHRFCCISCGKKGTMEQCNQTKINRYGSATYNNREKAKQTSLDKYGCKIPCQSKQYIEHNKQVRIERYGSYNNKEKSKSTKLYRYGDENYNNRDKAKQTTQERYGQQAFNNREKAKQTTQERYGVDNVFQAEEIQNKREQSMLEKYGVIYAQQSEKIRETTRTNNKKKYGVDHPSKTDDVRKKLSESNRNHTLDTHDFIEKIEENGDWVCKCPHLDCNMCLEKIYTVPMLVYFARKEFNIEPCTRLLPIKQSHNQGTTLELFIRNLLDNYNIKYETNNRSILDGKELDIYIPSKNIAIECNGCYWHSRKVADYHINKYILCKKNNIQLVTIWEDQVIRTPEIVKSIILSKLGIYKYKIGARNCQVATITSKEANEFLSRNHIQGSTNHQFRFGLFHNSELVGVMTFNKRSKLSGSKNLKEGSYELNRFCSKLNTQIVGGADKLLKYFIKKYNPNEIVSFSSNDISSGELYNRIGFKQEGDTTSSYWYIDKKTMQRFHRTHFTKAKLKRMGYDANDKTEEEIMFSLPYYKIYDSGHLKWVLNLK